MIRLEPLAPCGPLTPQSTCPHSDVNLPPEPFYCLVCDRSWADGHRDLRTDPRDPLLLRRDDGRNGRNHKRPR